MEQLRKSLDRILEGMAGVSFLAMVLLTCWQVLTRYVLQAPSSWSEELVSYLFAWMALLGASLVTGERGHMNIPAVVEHLPKGAQKGFSVFAEGVAFLFSAVILFYGGIQIVDLAMGQMTSSLGVAIGVFYVVLPVCGVLNMLFTALNIYGICRGDIPSFPMNAADEEKKKLKEMGKTDPQKGIDARSRLDRERVDAIERKEV